jgi:hypothetical protein
MSSIYAKMSQKPMNNIVSDSTDLTTTRPDIPPITKTGAYFQGINLPDFSYKINLLFYILSLNISEIFRLFVLIEIIYQIINNTNTKVKSLDLENLKLYTKAAVRIHGITGALAYHSL